MDYKTIFDSLNVFRQLQGINGMPIKFTYAIVKNITAMEALEKDFQVLQAVKIDGQQELENAKLKVLQEYANKDDSGKPISKPNQFGQDEYDIENWDDFSARMEEFKREYQLTFDAIEKHNQELTGLLDEECEEFEPYLVDSKFLPVDANGNSTLSPQQLRYTIPFLTGDIDE